MSNFPFTPGDYLTMDHFKSPFDRFVAFSVNFESDNCQNQAGPSPRPPTKLHPSCTCAVFFVHTAEIPLLTVIKYCNLLKSQLRSFRAVLIFISQQDICSFQTTPLFFWRF